MSTLARSRSESSPRAPALPDPDPVGDPGKVCVIISSFRPLVGGAERATEALCARLIDRGVRLTVLTRRHPGLARHETIAGIPVWRLGHPSSTKLGSLTFALHALWRLASRLRDHRVLHVHNPDAPLLVGFVAKLLLGRRLLVTIHGDPSWLFSERRLHKRVRFRLLARLCDGAGVQSAEMGQRLVERGIPSRRVRTLPNGVDLALFGPGSEADRRRARSRLDVDDAALVYLFVGRLVDLKRVDLLLRAWAKVAPREGCRLLIVGDGPERDGLRTLAGELALEDVRFEGATDDVVPYLRAADVFVLPSSVEGLSCALLEAMAGGLAVVATDHAGNRTVVRSGENGLLFPGDDVEALGEGLRALRSRALRDRLGRRAAATVREEYSLASSVARHRSLYRELSAESSQP